METVTEAETWRRKVDLQNISNWSYKRGEWMEGRMAIFKAIMKKQELMRDLNSQFEEVHQI